MRLVVFTQAVDRNNFVLGFFHRWLEELAQHFAEVVVIAGRVGDYHLPKNVRVHSFRERPADGPLVRLRNFWRLARMHLSGADAVFFHMIPEFVLLSAPWLVRSKAMIGLWYTHRSVTWRLRAALWFVDRIFTPVPDSFGIPDPRVRYTGHAVDTEAFTPGSTPAVELRLMTSGRITPIKRYELLIETLAHLREWERSWKFDLIGAPFIPSDEAYLLRLKALARERGIVERVNFRGHIPYDRMPDEYRAHDVFISLTPAGSFDKAVLEAMASGLSVVTTNPAFGGMLPPEAVVREDAGAIAEGIRRAASAARPDTAARAAVVSSHSVQGTIETIARELSGVKRS